MPPNAARKEWLNTLTLAERLAYDRAFGEFWFSTGPWPAAAHQHAKNLHQHNARKGSKCQCKNAVTTAPAAAPTPVALPTPNTQ